MKMKKKKDKTKRWQMLVTSIPFIQTLELRSGYIKLRRGPCTIYECTTPNAVESAPFPNAIGEETNATYH